MANIAEIITELRDEITAGCDIDLLIQEYAADYSTSPTLIRKKFFESFTSVERVLELRAKREAANAARNAALAQAVLIPRIRTRR